LSYIRKERRLKVFKTGSWYEYFGPKRNENGKWRKLHNEELHSFLSSPNMVRVIKSRRLRWPGHVDRMKMAKVLL
jgi:hypothetical protein